jgi:LETM1 and EF-hand domain-containing protein 1, mitochondrial
VDSLFVQAQSRARGALARFSTSAPPEEKEPPRASEEGKPAAPASTPRTPVQPQAPEIVRVTKIDWGQLSSRALAVLGSLPKTVGSVLFDWLLRYPFESLWWAITDRPRLAERWNYIMDVIKHEAEHYWLGFKLLGVEIRTSSGLATRVLQGRTLTRREKKQLMRTTADLFRLVPVIVMIVVPFAEFALPVLLKVFPNILPSTFTSADTKVQEQKKLLQMRIQLASFLQDTMEFMGHQIHSKSSDSAEAVHLMQLVRDARDGKVLPAEDIVRVSKLFKDEITLESAGRSELLSMARLLGVPNFGSDGFMRFQLRSKIASIKEDDSEILKEGLDNLTKEELAEANRERGMRSVGLTEAGLRTQLEGWLDLSQRKEVPISLLVLSRALTFAAQIPAGDLADVLPPPPTAPPPAAALAAPSENAERALQSSIARMGKGIVEEALLDVAEASSKSSDLMVRKMRLRSLERENALINIERKAKEAAALAHRLIEEAEAKHRVAQQANEAGDPGRISSSVLDASHAAQVAADAGHKARDAYIALRRAVAGEMIADRQSSKDEHGEALPSTEGDNPEAGEAKKKQHESALSALASVEGARALARARRSGTDLAADADPTLGAIGDLHLSPQETDALLQMASASVVQHERAMLSKIKAARLQVEAMELLALGRIEESKESTAAAMSALATDDASKRVKAAMDNLLSRVEHDLDATDESVGSRLMILDRDQDGVLSTEELQQAILDVLGNRNMEQAARALVERLDVDKDGAITVEDVKRYAAMRAAAEAEAEWMHPEEVNMAVDIVREEMEEEEQVTAKEEEDKEDLDDLDRSEEPPSEAKAVDPDERR